jgi:hypothetical protein
VIVLTILDPAGVAAVMAFEHRPVIAHRHGKARLMRLGATCRRALRTNRPVVADLVALQPDAVIGEAFGKSRHGTNSLVWVFSDSGERWYSVQRS